MPPLGEEHGRNHEGARRALARGVHEPPGVGRIRASAHMELDGGEGTCGDRAKEDEGRNRERLRMELVEGASAVREHGAALGEDDRTGGLPHKGRGAGEGTSADRAWVEEARAPASTAPRTFCKASMLHQLLHSTGWGLARDCRPRRTQPCIMPQFVIT